jgi:hypothetical protein
VTYKLYSPSKRVFWESCCYMSCLSVIHIDSRSSSNDRWRRRSRKSEDEEEVTER